jgi:hypothetical protein
LPFDKKRKYSANTVLANTNTKPSFNNPIKSSFMISKKPNEAVVMGWKTKTNLNKREIIKYKIPRNRKGFILSK